MEQLVLLLIIAGISLINWLVEKSKKLREEKRLEKTRAESPKAPTPIPQPEPATPAPREDQGSEQMRRLLEAMGIPTDFAEAPTAPKPALHSQPEPPPVPLFEPPTRPATPRPSLRKARPTALQRAAKPSPWSQRLRSNTAIREAIVLREILGPPRALSQP